MRFEWDESKRQENLRKHGFDFMDSPEMFMSPMLVVADTRRDYGEDRWIGLGVIKGRIAVVAFTKREGREDRTIRIISLRKALKHEREIYEKEILY
jgi:uncharacterized protein